MTGYRKATIDEIKKVAGDGDWIDIAGGCAGGHFGYKTYSKISLYLRSSDTSLKATEVIYSKRHRPEHRNEARRTATNELVKESLELQRYFTDRGLTVNNTIPVDDLTGQKTLSNYGDWLKPEFERDNAIA